MRHLKRAIDQDYRDTIAKKCVEHVSHHGDISLTLYDVTTLYFETDKEDELRKVGFSKERRGDPQIIVGLLADRKGFPLDIACWEGNKSEKHTIVPVVEQFKDRHNAADMVVVPGAISPQRLIGDKGYIGHLNNTPIRNRAKRTINKRENNEHIHQHSASPCRTHHRTPERLENTTNRLPRTTQKV